MDTLSTPQTDHGLPVDPSSVPAHADARSASRLPAVEARLQQMVETGKQKLGALQSGVQGGIRAHPLQTVLIAASVACVIGLLIGRRVG